MATVALRDFAVVNRSFWIQWVGKRKNDGDMLRLSCLSTSHKMVS